MKPILSPLRYPGSKRGLVGYIMEVLKINDLLPSLYVEPFIGGGSVAINLLNQNLVEKVILVDRDPWISSFWTTVFFDTNWLVNQIQTMVASIDNWYFYKNQNPSTIREQALTCFFLNRTSFSGILEEKAGPIGGKSQQSEYLIDCRFTPTTRNAIIERIEHIARFRNKVHAIWNCTWNEAISRIRESQDKQELPKTKVFYYLDPPFFMEAESLYRYYFQNEDHQALRDYLLTLQDKWLLSYDSVDQVMALYGNALRSRANGTQHHNVELLYTIGKISKRKKGKEVIISNLENLPTPPISDSN